MNIEINSRWRNKRSLVVWRVIQIVGEDILIELLTKSGGTICEELKIVVFLQDFEWIRDSQHYFPRTEQAMQGEYSWRSKFPPNMGSTVQSVKPRNMAEELAVESAAAADRIYLIWFNEFLKGLGIAARAGERKRLAILVGPIATPEFCKRAKADLERLGFMFGIPRDVNSFMVTW